MVRACHLVYPEPVQHLVHPFIEYIDAILAFVGLGLGYLHSLYLWTHWVAGLTDSLIDVLCILVK